MADSSYNYEGDSYLFWFWRLKKGKVSPPEPAYVPVEEKYDELAPQNALREWYGRFRCPACGKPFLFPWAAFNCHSKASAYKVWEERVCRNGTIGCASVGDVIMTSINSGGGLGPH